MPSIVSEGLAGVPWSSLGALLTLSMTVYFAWSLWRHRQSQDFFYTLLGLYFIALQLPILIPALGQAMGITCPLGPDLPSRLAKLLPAAALLFLAETRVWKKRA